MNKNTQFPLYRKLSNGKHWYKILGPDEFEELMIIGNKNVKMNFKVVQFPDQLRLKDMIDLNEPFVICTASEYENNLP